LIIAALALENKTFLLHHDEYFEMIVPYFRNLQTRCFNSN
jgi:predicted nucleic acid-binding protein